MESIKHLKYKFVSWFPSFNASKVEQNHSKPSRNDSVGIVCISVSTFVLRQLQQIQLILTSSIFDGNKQAFKTFVRLLIYFI